MREDPIFTKCFHCIPLKSCLHAWVVVKIVADLALSFCSAFLLLVVISLYDGHFFDNFRLEHVLIIITAMLMFDCTIMFVLSVGLCKKSVRVIKLFYYYNWAMMVFEACTSAFLYVWIFMDTTIEIEILYPICTVAYICLDICIALTAKSEMIKLRNKEQFEFVKIPAPKTEQKTQEVSIEIDNNGFS